MTELHYITPIGSLASICDLGLLSHNRAAGVPHVSVANLSVQNNRVGKHVPQGMLLHDYVNLYFDARNPMMTALRGEYPELIVIRVHPSVLDEPETVVSDGNAASHDTRFFPSPQGLAGLEEQYVYATWWTDNDPFAYYEKKRKRCAEVLVPHHVPPEFLLGCYAYDDQKASVCSSLLVDREVEVNRNVFL